MVASEEKAVTLTFSADGKVGIEAHGFHGASCSPWVDAFDRAIAGSGRRVHVKPAFYMGAAPAQRKQVRRGFGDQDSQDTVW